MMNRYVAVFTSQIWTLQPAEWNAILWPCMHYGCKYGRWIVFYVSPEIVSLGGVELLKLWGLYFKPHQDFKLKNSSSFLMINLKTGWLLFSKFLWLYFLLSIRKAANAFYFEICASAGHDKVWSADVYLMHDYKESFSFWWNAVLFSEFGLPRHFLVVWSECLCWVLTLIYLWTV